MRVVDKSGGLADLTSDDVLALVGKIQEGLTYKTAADILGLNRLVVEHELNDINLRGFVVYISEKAYRERKSASNTVNH